MEESVPAQLREVGLRRALGQEFSVDPPSVDLLDVIDLHPRHKLHRHDPLRCQVPVHIRYLLGGGRTDSCKPNLSRALWPIHRPNEKADTR